MSLTMELWQIDKERLVPMDKATLDLEKRLETWIEQDISLTGLDAMIIGRQVHTGRGGYIDLLAIDINGDLLIIELKRSKTPRDIVSQCFDYGSWVTGLSRDEIGEIYTAYKSADLEKDFAEYFESPLPEKINITYRMVIVAEELDESTERIVNHLSEKYSIDINAVFFNIFTKDGSEFIARSWLKDPIDLEEKADTRKRAQWTGYYFVNTGIRKESPARDWDLNIKYSFISAGGGTRWINAIKKLKEGDRIFAYIKGEGCFASPKREIFAVELSR